MNASQFPTPVCSACGSTAWRWTAPLGQVLYGECRACGLVQHIERDKPKPIACAGRRRGQA